MKKAIVFILNFLLIILLVSLSIVIILSKTILNKNYIMSSLQKSNFYNELSQNIQNDFDNYLAKAGIPTGTLNNLYTLNDLERSTEDTLDSIYYNKPIQSNIDVKERTESILKNYDKKESLANEIANVYEKKVAISPKYVNIIGQKISKILPTINIGITIIGIAAVMLIVIILIVLHNKKDCLNTIGIAFFTTGVLGILLKVFIGSKFDNIFLLNDAFSKSVIYIINDIIAMISFVGIFISILGLIAIIGGAFINKKAIE